MATKVLLMAMRLLDIIQNHCVIPCLNAKDKQGVLEEMLDYLVKESILLSDKKSTALQALMERENKMSTGLTDTIAIPHATTDVVTTTVGVLGISRTGIPFSSIDHKDAKVIFLFLIPSTEFRKHIKTLAEIAQLMSSQTFRDRLLAASTSEDILAAIRHVENY